MQKPGSHRLLTGLVRRNADGKETRFITKLTAEELEHARGLVEAFGQRVCGYDILRCDGGSREYGDRRQWLEFRQRKSSESRLPR